jgi:hypothetical protein
VTAGTGAVSSAHAIWSNIQHKTTAIEGTRIRTRTVVVMSTEDNDNDESAGGVVDVRTKERRMRHFASQITVK